MLMKLLLIPEIYGFFTVILNRAHPPSTYMRALPQSNLLPDGRLGILNKNPRTRLVNLRVDSCVHELPRVQHLNLDLVWLPSLTELWVSKIKWKGLKQQNGEPTTRSADTDRC